MIKRIRYIIFLRDVAIMALTAFGGPQAHIAIFLDRLVTKRAYLTEEELIELNALCQILPGPTSTQTITAIAFRIGGPNLAYLTLIVWILPAVTLMIAAALGLSYLQQEDISIDFTRFIQPIAVGFVAYAAYRISLKIIKTRTALLLMLVAAVASYFFRSPYIFPVLILAGGLVTAFRYKAQPKEAKTKLNIQWANFYLWGGVLISAALLGNIWDFRGVLLFENFYRNGSLIFGGGQVLIPYLFTEFVEFKMFLTSEDFLNGYGMAQAVPGPTFGFSAFIGAMAMEEQGVWAQIGGGLLAAAGIFLPGTFLIFFVIRFWEGLKKYRPVKASLEGIAAVSAGLVLAAALILLKPVSDDIASIIIMLVTMMTLLYTKIPAPFIILAGLLAGLIIP
ncbi:chromate efflux transporter [Roseivirga sp. BDSF3-8]|uniref:chromate efflux transporter n=1 Tax=Roseivirga sp. BDSF3-8 TaxID=3241598 RepID=UPI0035325138